MALTEEQKQKALKEYEKNQRLLQNSKKSGPSEPKTSKEEAKKSVQEMNEKVKQNAAKEKELMAGRTDPNLYKTDKKEEKKEDKKKPKKETKPSSKPTVNGAEVLSSNYVPPRQAAQQKIANSAVDRILNPTAHSQPADSTSSAPSFMNPHQARSDSIARRAGVRQETLDNIQAQNNYGKDVFTESFQAGIANYLSNAVGTADILTSLTPAGMISNAINGRENSPWNQLNASLQKWQEEKEADRQQAVINNGNKAAEFVSQVVTTATQMVPDILISIATGGAGKAVTAVDKAGDAIKGIGKLKNIKSFLSAKKLLPALRNSAISTMQNPNFWNSFGQILYPEYEDALREGATENEAVTTAILSAFVQAKIEGGGIQKLPKTVSPTLGRAIYNFVKSAVDEGNEEVTQGIVSGITQKLIFDRDKQLYSNISGDDAIFNLPDAWSEWVMGTFMGGLMGAPGAMMSMGNALLQPTAPVTPNAPTDVSTQPTASPVPTTPPVAESIPVAEPTPAVEASPDVPNVAPEATQTTPEQKVSDLQKNKERLEKNIASLEGRTDPDALKLKSNWQALIARIDSEIANITGEKPQAEPAPFNEADNVPDPTITDEPLSDDEIQAAVDKFEKGKAKSAQNVQPTPEPQPASQVEPVPEPQVEPKVEQKSASEPQPAQKPAVEHDEKVEQLIPKEENIPSTPEPNQLVPEMANDESRADYRKRMEKEWKKSEHGEGETFKAWFDEHWKQLKDEGKVSKIGRKEYLKKLYGENPLKKNHQNSIINTEFTNGGNIYAGKMGEKGENSGGSEGVRGVSGDLHTVGEGIRADNVGKIYSDGRNKVLYRVLSENDFTEAVKRQGADPIKLYDVSDNYDGFSKALAEGKASNPKGYMVDGKSVQELEESGAKCFLTEDGSAGVLVTKDGDIEGVFKNSKTSKAKRVVYPLLLTAVANGGNKLDCYGPDLATFYNGNGFEAVGRVEYVYGFNPEMDEAIKKDIASGKLQKEPDVYAMKLRDDVDANTVASKMGLLEEDGGFHIQTQEELDALPLYEGENSYDEMLSARDELLKAKNDTKKADVENSNIGSFNAQKTEEKPVVEEAKPKEQPKKEEPKPKATQVDVLLQNMDALGSDVFDNQENIEQKSEAKTEKKKQLFVKEILNSKLTETQIKRYSDRIDAINAYLENGYNSLSAEQKKNYEKVLDFVDSPTPENLIQKRNEYLKELYGDNPPAELMKDFATETKPKEQPAQPESVSQEEVDNAKKLLKELDYSNADISKMQPSEIVALAKSLESEAPDTAVGAHKAGENPVAHAAAEYGTYDVPEDVYTDYYRYLDKEKVNAIDRNVLKGKTEYNDDIKSYYEAVPEMVLDGVEFSEKDGKYYAGDKEIPKAVYNFGKYLEKNGVQYWNNKGEWIPVQMDEEHFVSRFLRNVASSKYGSDKNLDLLEDALKNGTFTYQQRHNKTDLKNAESYIKEHGIEESLKELKRFTDGEIPLKPDQITEKLALGFTLVDMAYEIGDTVSADSMLADLAPWATGSGQALQFFSVMQRRGKPDKPILGVRKATAESYVKKFIKGLNVRYKNKLHGKQISLTPEDFEAWTNAVGTDKEIEVAEDMFKKLANQIPSSWIDRFNSWRYFCMLCAPTTHAKNIASNVSMNGASFLKDVFLSRLEANYAKKHSDYIKTASIGVNKENKKFAKGTYEEANAKFGQAGTRYSSEGNAIEGKRTNTFSGADYKIFKGVRRGLGKVADGLVNSVSHLLEAEDTMTKKHIYARKVAEIMKANGWTEEYFNSGSSKAVRDFEFAQQTAIKEAYKATFNNENGVQKMLTSWRKMPDKTVRDKAIKYAIGALVELIFPFKKVTANIPARAIEYSPVGIAQGLLELKFDSKNENFDAHQALDHIAAGAAGSSIALAGTLLGFLGVAQLTGGDESEDKLKENRGWKNYSLKIGDYYLGLDDIAPVTTMLMGGVKLAQEAEKIIDVYKDKKFSPELGATIVGSIIEMAAFGIDGILQLDFFRSISDLMSSYGSEDGTRGIFKEKLEGVAESLVGQIEPNILRKIMRTIESDYANAYYYDKNEDTPPWLQNIRSGAMLLVPDDKIEQLVYNASGKKVNIPGYTDLAVRYDKWGRSINPEEFWVKAANNLMSPFQISKDRTTPVDTELERLYGTTKKPAIVPKAPAKDFSVNNKKIYMTAKEYSDYSRELGKARYNNLEKLFSSKYYKELDDEEKVLAIEKAYSVADDIAKDKLFEKPKDFYTDKPIPRASDYNEAMKDGLSPAAYIVSSAIYNDTQKTKTKTKEDRFYDYLVADKTTSAKEDALIMEHVVGKDFSKHYLVTSSPQEVLDIYEAEKQEGGKDTDIAYLADKFNGNDLRAFALYSGVNGTKKYENGKFSNFGAKQLPKAETLVNKKGWSGEDVAKAARCVTGLGDYLGKSRKTKENYIAVLVEAGFTKEKANEFYDYYGW